MSLIVVGTLAYDSIETPAGKQDDILGGAATHFSYSASFFTKVSVLSVVGEDFRMEDRETLVQKDIDLSGVQVASGKTFRWSGRYEGDMNVAETLDTQLNVFGEFDPVVPEGSRDCPFVFLANSPPALQARVLDQMGDETFAVMDTMNLWIETTNEELRRLVARVDGITLNDQEARMLTGHSNLISAGRAILEMGPRFVFVKKGEHGAFLFSRDFFFALPAYPVNRVVDPTGAGDSFAGGVMGALARGGAVDESALKRAIVYGTVMASYNVEDFSLDRLRNLTWAEIEARFWEFLRFTSVT